MSAGDCTRGWRVISCPALERKYSKIGANELLRICANFGDSDAWEEFLCRFHPPVFATVRRTAARYTVAHPDLCDELEQQVYFKLIDHGGTRLSGFVPTHEDAAYGYLKIIAKRVVQDYFRRKGALALEPLEIDPPVEPDIDGVILFGEIDEFLKTEVSDRNRRILWLSVRQGLTAEEIAAIPGIGLTQKGVETVLRKVKDLVIAHFGPSVPANGDGRKK